MQDENNNNQPVILNLNPVNDTISQFIQLQTGILSEKEMFVPSDSILPVGTRVKIEYRLKSFGQKENVKIIDAVGEVIGPEVDSEKGRRGVRVKLLKMSPTSQMLIQKLIEKMKSTKPQSGEKVVQPVQPQKIEQKEADTLKPDPVISGPKVEVSEPKIQITEPTSPTPTVEPPTPSISDIMANLDTSTQKSATTPSVDHGQTTLAEIMSKEIEQPKSKETQSEDEKQAQYVFEYLPPGQPIEENTGIVKIREIVRSTDVSVVKKSSKIWFVILICVILIAGIIGFFYFFPQFTPKIFVKSHEVSNVITKRDLTPDVQPQNTQITVPVQQQEPPKQEEKKEEKQAEEKSAEEKKIEEKVKEPEIQPLTTKEEKGQQKAESVKIITGSKIKKEREKETKIAEEKEKRAVEEKAEKAAAIKKVEETKGKKEAQSAEPAKIIIQITPTDADLTIFIDGNQVGTMPTLSKQLPSGTHTIKVVADGYNDEIRKVDLSEGETKTIKINLKERQ